MPSKLESDLEKQVVNYAKQQGILCVKFTSPSRRGVPDRLLIGPLGEVYFLELKQKGKMPTPLQWHEIHTLNKFNIRAGYVDNIDDAKLIIDTLARI
jgi:hypothetical protein